MPGFRSTLLFFVSALSVGCGGVTPVPIEPRILLDGKPLPMAAVSFVRDDGEQGRAAFGLTDRNGVATLTTFEPGDGVLPGAYRVVVVKSPEDPHTYVVTEAESTDPKQLAMQSAMAHARPRQGRRRQRQRSIIPEVYADPGRTPLRSLVKKSTRAFDIEVQSDKR